MVKDKVFGVLLLSLGALGIVVYGWLVFLTDLWPLILKLTGFIAVAGILGIIGWIGYTLATTPSPEPIEEPEEEVKAEKSKDDEEKP